MVTVKELLQIKGSQVWTISPEESLRSALERMSEKNVGALVVVDGDAVVGIFSERDYATGVVEEKNFTLEMPVSRFMSSPVYAVAQNDSVDECIALMTQKRFRHLPVMEGGHLIGLISIGDLVKQDLSEMEKKIRDLEDYIWIHMI